MTFERETLESQSNPLKARIIAYVQ